jgi:hypothetical protein
MKLHHYIFCVFFGVTSIMLASHGSYSAASYNPVKGEVVTHNEYTPDYVYVHESVHERLWWESWLLLISAWVFIFSLSFGIVKLGNYSYLSYIVLSVHAELTAYLLTPIQLNYKIVYIVTILVLGLWNLTFWNYFFKVSNIRKPLSKATWREIVFTPIMPVVFWLI